jgi:hypothetical protein
VIDFLGPIIADKTKKEEVKMSVFKDTQQMYGLLEELWNYCVFEQGLAEKMRQSEVSFKFILNDPGGYLYVDPDNVITGDEAKKKDAVINMEMSGDSVHQFWLRQLKLPVALATKKIKAKGPVPKVLKMLPHFKPVHEAYPKFCEKHGIPTS